VEVSIRSDQSVLHAQQLFDDRTSYRTDYVPHPQEEHFQRKREEYIPNSSFFNNRAKRFYIKRWYEKKTKFSSFFLLFELIEYVQ
jgi:hypothetical protein